MSRSPHEACVVRTQIRPEIRSGVRAPSSGRVTLHLRGTEAPFGEDGRTIITEEWTVCFRDASGRWAGFVAGSDVLGSTRHIGGRES